MRVVHIEAGRHLYGGAAQVRYLVDGLARAGIDNALICAQGGALERNALSAQVLPIPMHGDLDLGMTARLRRCLRALGPDVVHVHSRRGAELFGGAACALERLPAVVTRRVDTRESGSWTRLKYRPYRAVIAISRAVEAQLARAGVERERVHTIPSAVDTARYRPDPAAAARLRAAFAWPADALVVAVVAQLIPRKGHALLFAELPALIAREPRLRVACFGRGAREHELAALISRLALARHVRLAGFRSDLPELLPGADVLVHPATREGLGVAVLEALACGVPVVAFDAGGVADVVTEGVHGRLVEAGDAPALGAALAALAADPEARRAFGAAGRAHVERRFSIERMVDRHLELYAQIGAVGHAERASGPARARPGC